MTNLPEQSATLPIIPGPDGIDFLKQTVDTWSKHSAEVHRGRPGSIASLALQSFPSLIGKKSAEQGGNAMGLGTTDGPRFITEITNVFQRATDREKIAIAGRNITTEFASNLEAAMAKVGTAGGGQVETYLPYFINDAMWDQDVLGSYKEQATFSALQKKHDPEGFFSGSRTGGFKYSV